MTLDAIVINSQDNVATAVKNLHRYDKITLAVGIKSLSITLLDEIPAGHKFSIQEIECGKPVTKYGEIIGLATNNIEIGSHVHIHNVEGQKGRGDLH